MDQDLQKFIAKVKDDPMMPIDTNYLQIQKKLQENGLMYQQTLKPTQLLVHPLNRGGAMLSEKDPSQELSNQMAEKKSQIAANETIAHASEGTLCPPSGQERFLSLGSSHLSQFCKAALHGCTTSNEELTAISHNGNLNLQACCGSQGNQNPFHTMCTEGWPWDIIVSQVEETFPDLPQLVQAALNSSHGIAQKQTEIEIMAPMASNYAHTNDLKKALQLAESTKPKCMPYIAAGHYVQKYSGVTNFDNIHVLAHVSKAFTNTLTIGEDFMTTIAFMDFKERSTTFPWTRAGLLAANLQSPICKVGIGLHDLLNGSNTGAPTSSSTAEQEESHDAKLIAKRKWGMEENQFYHQKGDLKHWQFKSMTDTVAKFEHMPLFPPKDGQPWEMEVELEA
ncbi:unnamed protein product [Cladocopium goreaui]|uniref:Uncharacterized protein n=1 Tax=Cladocopium goreaui TaxID=2562237 RepID=A0A9P1BJM9_9DINO|nr:unnamed protein product [Cladocopium goreaui]